MAVSTKVGTFTISASDTAGTTQQITVGFQPKLILLWSMGQASAVDAVTNQTAQYGFGAAASTTVRQCVGGTSTHAAAAIDGGRIARTDACFATVTAAGAVDGLLDISAIDSTSFTVIVDDQFANTVRISYMAVGGSDITDVAMGTFAANTTAGTQDITGLSFQPDVLLTFGSASTTAAPFASSSRDFLSVGAAVSAANQAIISIGEGPEANATSQASSYLYYGEVAAPLFDTPTELRNRAAFVQFLSNGFQLNWLEAAFAYQLMYVCIKGGSWLVGNLQTQTDTTTDIVESGFGFQPKGAMLFSHNMAQSTQDTVQSDARLSVGAFTSTTERQAQALLIETGLADTDVTNAIEHDEVYINIASDSTVQGLMDVKSVDSDGFTLLMDDADPAQGYIWYLAVGDSGTPPPSVAAPVGDSGSGSDAIGNVAVALSRADSGSGTDNLSIGAALALSDSGSGIDLPGQISALLTVLDSGSGDDSLSIAVTVSITDSGAGADALSILQEMLLSVSDSGSGADSINAISVTLSVADSGSGAENLTVTVSVAVADVGTLEDAVALLVDVVKSVADSGSGADVVSPAVSLSVTESGSGDDAAGVVVSLAVTDDGSMMDVAALVGALLTVADSGSGNDTIGATVNVVVSDSGVNVEVAGVTVAMAVSDSGSGADSVNLLTATLKSVLDSASGSDSLSVVVTLGVADGGSGAEALGADVGLGVADSGSGNDLPAVGAALSLADSGSGVDALLVAVLATINDFATGTDSAGNITVNVPVADIAAVAEVIGQVAAVLAVLDSGSGVDVVVKLDTSKRIVSIVFSVVQRTMAFVFAARSVSYSFLSRSVSFSLGG